METEEGTKEALLLVYLRHFALSMFLCATSMALVIPRSNIYVFTCSISLCLLLISTRFQTLRGISLFQIVSALFFCLLFAISSVFIESSFGRQVLNNYFLFFVLTGIGSLLVSNYRYEFEFFIKSLIIIGLLFAPIIVTTNYSQYESDVDNDEWMSKVYAIMPFIVASIYYLFEGKKNLYKVLSVICILSYSSMVVLHTPRGAIVSMIISFFVFLYQKALNEGVSKFTILILLFVLIIVVIVSWNIIFNWLQIIADEKQLRWLQKFVDTDDVSNSRAQLYNEAFTGFLNKPLLGHGIASFRQYEIYPHNLFLEMMYETGILMVVPMIFYLIQAIKIVLRCDTTIEVDYRIITFLFLISFVQLMFSSFFWRNTAFWMLIWSIMRISHNHYSVK